MVDRVGDVGGNARVADALKSRVELVEHGAAMQAGDEVVLLGVSAISAGAAAARESARVTTAAR